jgi:Cu-Zn family superoxide dismutase
MGKRLFVLVSVLGLMLFISGAALAGNIVVQMNLITDQGVGKSIGTVVISDTPHGLLLVPMLTGLMPGIHGFHVHQNADCGPAMKDGKQVAGLAAGGHYDPAGSGKHEGPYAQGHLGDLPALYVGADGMVTTPVLAPRLKTADLIGRSLMIHAGGDNYSDMPAPLGGGGGRIACGIIK